MAKYGRKASEEVEEKMHEMKRGKLRSGSGKKVTSRKQAVAIGLSEARREGGKVPAKKSGTRSASKKSASKKSGSKKSASKKSASKKSASRKSTSKKSAAGRSTGRKSASRKATTKKSASKKR